MNSNTNQKINQVSEKHSSSVSTLPSVHIMHARLMKEDACSKIVPFLANKRRFRCFYERLLALRATHEKVKFLSVSSPQVITG